MRTRRFAALAILTILLPASALAQQPVKPRMPDLEIIALTLNKPLVTNTACFPGQSAFRFSICGEVFMTATVRNNGNQTLPGGATYVLFSANGPVQSFHTGQLTNSIAPGATGTATGRLYLGPCDGVPTVCSPPIANAYTFGAVVDPDNLVFERNESNNQFPGVVLGCSQCP